MESTPIQQASPIVSGSDSSVEIPVIDRALDRLTERVRGMVTGIAVGDALAAAVQYRRAGTFMPISDLLGGGPYDLPRGAFSDDAAVAYILLDALLENQSFKPAAWIDRLSLWANEGIGSSTGVCVGISACVARLLRGATEVDHSIQDRSAREFLVRAWVLGVYFAFEEELIDAQCASLMTMVNDDPEFLALSQLIAHQAARLVRGESLLEGAEAQSSVALTGIDSADALWQYVLTLSQANLSVKEKFLQMVNLGQDADIHTTLLGAVVGTQVGVAGLPAEWIDALTPRALINSMGYRLARGMLERWLVPV